MVKLTPAAAEQIRASAHASNAVDLPLRIEVAKNDDGSLQYALGFDDVGGDEDVRFETEGIAIVMPAASLEWARQLLVDYVTLDSGETAFVFLNPQDPNFNPPTDRSEPQT